MQDIFVIELDRNRYGIPLAQVCEVLRSASSLPLPGSPPVVEGVLNVRGQTAPVFDLRLRFGLPARPPCHTDHLLLAWAG
ncbi:MAG: chemotaxis protein CheW, partial [Candidatus Eremiobacteraeota bacterium]|nr:chemotaxis protein CheW [Candidatus Eremiobacteraeota bacterium]